MEFITQKAVEGRFYARLEDYKDRSWLPSIAIINNDAYEESIRYAMLGATPPLREWIGRKQSGGVRENSILILNKDYEATLEMVRKDILRDKSGQALVRAEELALRGSMFPLQLLTELIEDGEDTAGYDGEYFFDTDHSEGDSGTQSNDISVDISGVATSIHGSTTAPSVGEIAYAIMSGIRQILSLKDDRGKTMNNQAMEFTVMVPIGFMEVATMALSATMIADGEPNIVKASNFKINLVINPDLSWTTKLAVFRTDAPMKPFIYQQDGDLIPLVHGYPTDAELRSGRLGANVDEARFWEKMAYFSVELTCGCGFAQWQYACLVTLI